MENKRYSRDLKQVKKTNSEEFSVQKDGNVDRFGNQHFISKEFVYNKRSENKNVFANILISPEGQKFIASHPRILHALEKGLETIETRPMNELPKPINLEDGSVLRYITSGGQSNAYILETKEGKYIIKTKLNASGLLFPRMEIDQPYVDEMSQTQSIAEDLKDELLKLKVKMPKFLFASGQISCTLFEEEEKNMSALTKERVDKLFYLVSRYIETKKKEQDPLWKNIEVDNHGNEETIARNFVTKKNGTIIWIDPFLYEE